VVLMLVPFGILSFFALFYEPGSGSGFAPYVYFAGIAALPAIVIGTTARSPREWVLVMRLTLVTTLLFGLGLAAAIVFPGALV
jgi:1,4-dihydroxy-2-naphthoate octaprenyltransferase